MTRVKGLRHAFIFVDYIKVEVTVNCIVFEAQ